MERIISTLVWAAIIQGVLLTVLYLFSKKHNSLANRLLGFFLMALIVEAINNFSPFDHIAGYSTGYYFSFPEVKLFFPLLFFHYIMEKIGRSKIYRSFLKVHYLFAFAILGITVFNILLYVFKKMKIEELFGYGPLEIVFMGHQYYAFLLVIAVLIITIIEMRLYKKVVLEEYSDYGMLNIAWLWRFIFAIIPMALLWGAELLRIILGRQGGENIILATWGFVVLFIYFVSFQAFKHKNLFEEFQETTEGERNGQLKSKGDDSTGAQPMIIGEEDKIQINLIKAHMDTHEPYLDPSLTMRQLSKQLNMNDRDLSLLINHKLNKHFFDFVNEYRIKKAMDFLRDPEEKDLTVLEILYKVGFNSKSSFNTVFKKYTGKTPTQYRRSHSLSLT